MAMDPSIFQYYEWLARVLGSEVAVRSKVLLLREKTNKNQKDPRFAPRPWQALFSLWCRLNRQTEDLMNEFKERYILVAKARIVQFGWRSKNIECS